MTSTFPAFVQNLLGCAVLALVVSFAWEGAERAWAARGSGWVALS